MKMSKEKENKNQNYSGNSIASHWLSGTWLGNLLGYGNNTYTDGYETERQNPSLKESAQGQQLSRMKDTAKNYGKIALTGMSFGNPLVARSTLGAALNTVAQSYFLTEGLQDAYNRFMKKDKNAGDALWAGLDLAGAVPAVGSVVKNGKYVLPEVKNTLDKQARITARQYADYQPTTQLSDIPKGEPSKPFTYLWSPDLADAIGSQNIGKYEDAATKGFKDSQNIFLNKNIFEAFYKNPRIGITRSYDIGKISPKEYSEIRVWPENIRFVSLPENTLGTTHNYMNKNGIQIFIPNWYRKNASDFRASGNINLDAAQTLPLRTRQTAQHEAIHSKGFGLGIDPENIYKTVLGDNFQDILDNNVRLKYLYKYPELAAHVLVDWAKFNPIKLGQKLPKSSKDWNKFADQIQIAYKNSINGVGDLADFHEFLNPILEYRSKLNQFLRYEDIQKLDKQLFEILNGTAF